MFYNIVQRVLLREYNCQHPSIAYSGEMTRKLQDFAKDLHTKNHNKFAFLWRGECHAANIARIIVKSTDLKDMNITK